MENALSVGNVFRAVWGKVKPVWGRLILVLAAMPLVQMVIGYAFDDSVASPILSMVLSFIFSYVAIRVGLMAVRGEKIEWRSVAVFEWRLILFLTLSSILLGILVMAGFILLIVPGIIIAIRLGFSGFFVVDEKTGPIVALKSSWALTKGYTWRLFVLSLVSSLAAIIGTGVTLGIGLLIIAPFMLVFRAYLYTILKDASLPVAAEAVPMPEVKA